ncbi:Uncharacterized protein YhaN [Mesobacillus persicus]|uniref:Uncharacterized protein YhaN n=1 Tax=Mesobacillus persicus TaxID=930146 RepID=A0A1H8DWW9_9BACI|nr:AAA family ATPase [Mesobacillus persicus]SEN11752.1 Uncharacterized protein YhaN [Mesobacillus persicus]
MHLIEIHIYGYGKLENVKLTNLNNIQVFYGENEAGKSTIMSFIHSILFGFPTKQQAELRYEPKRHSKYGGLIKAKFTGKGIAVIERVAGKATGDVSVTLEDGTVGGEGLLHDLLNGMDKGTFQSIFSFNLQGLQNIHQLKGEDLGRYLFSAGALGTERLLNAEKLLQKEMEQRFKPGGKRPHLNEKLKELREVYEALKKAESENKDYQQLNTDREETERKLKDLSVQLANSESQVYKLKELERVWPLMIEEKQLKTQLTEYEKLSFPTDGISRLDRLIEQKKPIQARLSWLAEKSESLKGEAEKFKPDLDLLKHESEVSNELEKIPLYNQIVQEQEKLNRRVDEINEEINQINDQLDTRYTQESISMVNTSVLMKDNAEDIQLKQQQLKERKHSLDVSFLEEKTAMEELEQASEAKKREILDKHTRARLNQQLDTIEHQERLEADLRTIEERVKGFQSKQTSEQERKRTEQKRQGAFVLMLSFIFLTLVISGFLNNQWVLTTSGVAGLVILIVMYFRSKASVSSYNVDLDDEGIASLNKRAKELKEQLKDAGGLNGTSIRLAIEKDEANRRKLAELAARIDQQNNRYERIIQAFEKWEKETRQLYDRQEELAQNLMIPKELARGKVYDAFLLVEGLKQRFREKARLEKQLLDLEKKKQAITENFQELSERFLLNRTANIQEVAVLLRKKLREEIDKQGKFREISLKLQEMSEESSQLKQELLQFQVEEEGLYELAHVDDEETFRQMGYRADQLKELENRLAAVLLQLETAGITREDREAIAQGKKPDEELQMQLKFIEECKSEQSRLHDAFAEIKHRMGLLEEGGLYADLLHRYRQMKYEFEEESKEWARYAVAKEILSNTVESYKTERLPKLLDKAGEFFKLLTDDEYIRILPQGTGTGFILERKDHTLFVAEELSQATAEQVYVSLRLALTVTLFSRFPFPIIIDDSFVNFDKNRAQRMISLLRTFSENQILFFTCHQYILNEFQTEEILMLKDNIPQQVS